jgi:hypothetical protein
MSEIGDSCMIGNANLLDMKIPKKLFLIGGESSINGSTILK